MEGSDEEMVYKSWFKILLILQLILICIAGAEITQDFYQMTLFSMGSLFVLLGVLVRKHLRHNVLLAIGCFSLMMSFWLTSAAWINIGLTIFLLVSFLTGKAKIHNELKQPLSQYVNLETTIPREKHVSYSHKWFGDQHIGQEVYEWDDMVLNSFMGDTVIDLGKTILRNGDNYIVLNKLIGDTKLIVPPGMGIHLKHQGLMGEVTFIEHKKEFRNHIFQYYSEDFDKATKKIHIISTLVLGDVEVIVL